jgi:hypothetical protein
MVASPVLGCAVLGRYEWKWGPSSASGGLWQPTAGSSRDAHSPLRDWEGIGFRHGDCWSALEPSAVMAMEWGHLSVPLDFMIWRVFPECLAGFP